MTADDLKWLFPEETLNGTAKIPLALRVVDDLPVSMPIVYVNPMQIANSLIAARKMLAKHRWSAGMNYCPECNNSLGLDGEHKSNCALAALIPKECLR